MNNNNLKNNITFTSIQRHKNYDMAFENDSFCVGSDGEIKKLRVEDMLLPELIGEYSMETITVDVADHMGIDLNAHFSTFKEIQIYKEFQDLINKKEINLSQYGKVILVHKIALKPDYRESEVFKEFVEFIYRTQYDRNTLVLFHLVPAQYHDDNYFFYDRLIKQRDHIKSDDFTTTSAFDFYNIGELEKIDKETAQLKLFKSAQHANLKHQEGNFFQLNINKILSWMWEKNNEDDGSTRIH